MPNASGSGTGSSNPATSTTSAFFVIAAVEPFFGYPNERTKVARYRERDETDLVWNRIRRQITRDLDTEIMNRREEVLNLLLSGAWEDYTKAIASGQLIEVEAKYQSLISEVVKDIVRPQELPSGSMANG